MSDILIDLKNVWYNLANFCGLKFFRSSKIAIMKLQALKDNNFMFERLKYFFGLI